MTVCPFCAPDPARVFHDDDPAFLCLWDGFPVSSGHALVVLRRHVSSWFEASVDEQRALLRGIAIAREAIVRSAGSRQAGPDGFNIGINVGAAAGQSVLHLHVHVIPRYAGDVPDPRGGVRHVIPGRGNYLADSVQDTAAAYGAGTHEPFILGNTSSPLLAALRADLAGAQEVDLAVAFVLQSGLALLQPHLQEVLDRGGRVRVLTGDYLQVTEPDALMRLLDLIGDAELRVFETDARHGFHPKAYLVRRRGSERLAYVGSSNLTRSALECGIEWNARLRSAVEPDGVHHVEAAFEALFQHPRSVALTQQWVDAYRPRHQPHRRTLPIDAGLDPAEPPPVPHAVQRDAMAALARSREAGNRAGLVVLATGLGKTWLAAFDSAASARVLFVAHREEILRQARDTFRRIRPDARLGLYTGVGRDETADVLFASIQTLGRQQHLDRFPADAFCYIVVDEFHHASAPTYRRLLEHFEPAFLLGLTATPERSDGGDLLALCGENLVYRCDLADGIDRGLLAPFHYFGVPDAVDYSNIPWRSSRFDPQALLAGVATEARARDAFEQWSKRGGQRTLGFCVSVRHAEYMRRYFVSRGVAVAAVHSEPDSDPRAQSLQRLAAGELRVVFAVDMFNEGVDVPAVDTVLMLRPTESRTLWLQQFGRGLRRAEDKSHLTVIDYVGNHRSFLQVPALLLPQVGEGSAALRAALDLHQRGELVLPAGCQITYELEAVDILRALTHRGSGALQALTDWYTAFRERNDARPTALEAWHTGFDPKSTAVRRVYGSWSGLVAAMGDSSPQAEMARRACAAFLGALESAPMDRSYRMVVLLAMIADDAFPGVIELDALTAAVRRLASRSAALTSDFSVPLDDHRKLRALLVRQPLRVWAEGRGTGGVAWFALDADAFRSVLDCPPQARDALRDLAREICEWRLAQYLERRTAGADATPAASAVSDQPQPPVQPSHSPK